MGLSAFNSGGSTIVAEKLVDALYRAIVRLSEAESKANKDSITQATNTVQYSIVGDAQKSFTATLNLPARMVKDATSGKIELKPRNYVVDYVQWEAGTGDLADATSLPHAVVILCENITYLERQIDPNIVIQTPNQVAITPNQENGTFDITVNFPVEVAIEETTGKVDYTMFDYLRVLDDQQ